VEKPYIVVDKRDRYGCCAIQSAVLGNWKPGVSGKELGVNQKEIRDWFKSGGNLHLVCMILEHDE